MKLPFASVALLLFVGLSAAADKSSLGVKVEPFTLNDSRGKPHSLADLKDSKGVVVAFVGVDCPLAKLYGPKLGRVAKDYEAKGVAFLAIDSNSQDSLTAIAAYARAHQIGFPVLKDLGGKVADAFGAERTPTVYLLDADRTIRYVGRVDDQYGIGYQRDKANTADLVNAIEDLLAGRKVAKAETKVEGCFIGRLREPKSDSAVTYTKHIAPILNSRCIECHRTGEIAPFELTSYSQAAAWSETIAEVVRENRMPPWHADPKHGKFSNDRRLTDEERRLIREWVAAGAPEGDAKDLPKPPTFSETGWQLPRSPDLVVPMRARPFSLQAEGEVKYQYFIADSGLKEDKWIDAMEVRPGNRAVVHHILVFAVKPGANADEFGGGVKGFLAAYVPGLRALPYPDGMAKKIPAGAKLVFQVHYTPNGAPQQDLSSVGFTFVDPAKVKHEVRTTSAAAPGLAIPAGASNHKVEASMTLNRDTTLLTFMPHMHLRGKSFRYEAVLPDGSRETLLDVPSYDFNWQTSYRLAEPRTLPGGTKLRATAHFDNSADNPNNPDPKKTVRWGDQTWNEMMIGYMDVAVPIGDKPTPTKEKEVKIPAGGVTIIERAKGLFGRYDKNGDGKLDEKEIDALPPTLKRIVMDYVRRMGE